MWPFLEGQFIGHLSCLWILYSEMIQPMGIDVDSRELNMWVDVSSLPIRVALERHETVLEDAC